MKISSQELVDNFVDLVLTVKGEHQHFDHVASPETATKTSLVFLFKAEDAPQAAAVVVTSAEVAEQLDAQQHFVVGVENVRLAQAKIKQCYDDYQSADSEWDAIHVSAVVHPSVKLGEHCRIGPNAVIGANCVLADKVVVRAGAVIEHNVNIDQGSIINTLANIGYDTQIGQNVVIQAGAIIGSEGFGFAPDNQKRYHRVPHTGHVVLEDDVHVGANACIDRGTYGVTRLARGVKIDNLVHIAHNVQIDEDSLLAAQSCVAGSSVIGKRVIASGQTGVLDHKIITDDVVLVQRCGASQDITKPGMWAGTPAKPFKEYVRDLAVGKKVAKLEQQLKELKQQIDEG